MSDKVTGHVKWFNEKKGFGFIINDQGEDIFVHYKDIIGEEGTFRTLHENDKVCFSLEAGAKGLKAQQVSLVLEE